MIRLTFLLVAFCAVTSVISESQWHGDHTQQEKIPTDSKESPLNREIIEGIFQQLSPVCRSQMEAAMETAHSQPLSSHVSTTCQEEIRASAQRAAGTKDKVLYSSPRETVSGVSKIDEEGDADNTSANNRTHSVIVVVVSLVAVFGTIIGYILYVNTALSQQVGTKKALRKKDKKVR